jgi:HSP20 family molecular chaperone IbpA
MSTNNTVAVAKQENTALMRKPEPVGFVTPLADIYETDDAYVVMLDMPGASKESISITMDRSSLVVRSTTESLYPGNTKLLYNEIVGGKYHRSFNLTEGIDREKVEASFENGVLTIKLFKKEEVKPREIQIR